MDDNVKEALRIMEEFLADPDPSEAYEMLLDVYDLLKDNGE